MTNKPTSSPHTVLEQHGVVRTWRCLPATSSRSHFPLLCALPAGYRTCQETCPDMGSLQAVRQICSIPIYYVVPPACTSLLFPLTLLSLLLCSFNVFSFSSICFGSCTCSWGAESGSKDPPTGLEPTGDVWNKPWSALGLPQQRH